MQDLFQLSFFKPNGQKATVLIGGYSSPSVIETCQDIFKDDMTCLCEYPERIESSNTESN